MLDTRYAFISAYLKGEESKLVTSDHINRMLKASNVRDALGVIKDTDVGSYLEEVSIKTFDDIDEYLWKYFLECIRHLESLELLPKEMLKILRAYIIKYDVLNIKVALQGILTHKKAHMIPVGIICRSRFLNELSNAENLDSIIEILEECKLGDYAYILKKHEKLLNEGLKSRLPVEARLDDEYHRNMQALTENLKDGFVLSKVVSLLIDLTNLQIICRAIIDDIGAEVTEYIITSRSMIPNKAIKGLLSLKLSDIPNRLENTQYRDIAEEISSSYDRAKSITVVEEIIDKHKFRLVKETLSPRMLSPVIIAWYLILKEIELRNLRLISKALIDNIPREEIENFLVL